MIQHIKDVNDVPYLSATLNYGYAGGFRLRATELIYLDVRYARIQSGELKRIEEIDVDSNGDLSLLDRRLESACRLFKSGNLPVLLRRPHGLHWRHSRS